MEDRAVERMTTPVPEPPCPKLPGQRLQLRMATTSWVLGNP